MSTADKLTYLNNTKNMLKDRLNSLGAEITSSTTFRNYLTWLDNFYNNVGDKTDIATNGIVGRTSQETTTGKNHLNPVPSDQATGGITTTANTNTGYITMVGTSDRNYPWILKAEANIPSGTTVVISSNSQYAMYARLYYDNSNYETINTSTTNFITLSHDIIRIAILANMPTGTVVNETCYVQIEEGSTATSFEKFSYGASPNPNYPQPINNLSGDVAYKISGKNLFDKDNLEQGASAYLVITPYIEISNTTITSSWETSLSSSQYNVKLYEYNANKEEITTTTESQTFSKQLESNTQYIKIRFYCDYQITPETIGNRFTNIMVTTSSDTPYEPYIEPQTFTIPLGDIELCDIDTYEDKIYSNDGRFYLKKNCGKVVLNGSEEWINLSTNNETTMLFQQKNASDFVSQIATNNNLFKTNKFRIYNCSSNASTSEGSCHHQDRKIMIRIFRNRLLTEDVSGFTTWITNNNVTCYGQLRTPTTTEITRENYPSLYNALKQIQDYLTAYKINKEFILGYSSPEIEY